MGDDTCTFCEIIARREPSRILYEDNQVIVFRNKLDWAPVMLLVVPRRHMTQTELWESGALLADMGRIAVKMGQEHCPNGFRILSNFGRDAYQSQRHGHLHVLGGEDLGLYVRRPRKWP